MEFTPIPSTFDVPVLPEHKSPYLEPGSMRLAITGGSGTGKTRSLLKIIPHFNQPRKLLVWCARGPENQPVYKDLEAHFQGTGTDVELHDSLGNVDDAVWNNKTVMSNPGCIIIVDDYSKDELKRSQFHDLFSRGRLAGLHCIIIVQDFFNIPKSWRTNITDYAIFPCDQPEVIFTHGQFSGMYGRDKGQFLRDIKECAERKEDGDRDWLHITPNATSEFRRIRQGMHRAIPSTIPCHLKRHLKRK
jgi:hypothetical protein